MARQNNYLSNPNSSFFDDEDVDDDTFLKGSRPGSNYPGYPYTSPSNNVDRERDILEERRQQLIMRKKEIEDRTIESSQRSLGLLRESEQIGVETAEELMHQREQLQRTEQRLDEINSTLRFSQKHIQGIKSVFGSFKNYLSGKSGDQPPIPGGKPVADYPSGSSATSPMANTVGQSRAGTGLTSPTTDQSRLPSHRSPPEQLQADPSQDHVTQLLDRNLEEMADSLSRLKGLGLGLSEEIESQNEMLEGIMVKTDKADLSLIKQNKDMKSLLKK